MRRVAMFVYGLACYGLFVGVFLYAIGFLANVGVTKSIDSGVSGGFWSALGIDLVLLGVFAAQHSIMARPAFKRVWTRVVSPTIERSTFVLATSLALVLLYWQWRPLPGVVWHLSDPAASSLLWGLFALGWATVFFGTFMIDHARLFGLAQVWMRLRGRAVGHPRFQTRGLYAYVRHPLMLGFLIAFWATPMMTAGHLLFAAASTGYILLATLALEEPDLERAHGDTYRHYRHAVPAFIPRFGHPVRVEDLGGHADQPAR
jgi:protein-S-isoprenylcysteine O-methyltransferase Ste14